ncbi:hypothetical protein BH24ACT4_BH24ACT4_25180 [soil metagenome]
MNGTSTWARIWAVARHDLRILRRDPAFLIIFTVTPIAFMAFTEQTFGSALALELDDPGLTGASVVVPGATVLFSWFLVGNLGFGIFREHGWGTWERLRASPLSTGELILAKSVAPVLSLAIQLVVLLGGGALLFGLEIRGTITAYLAVAASLAIMEVALGFLLLSVCRSVIQLNALSNAGAMLLGGLGGAVAPVELLPGWAQAIAPATPTYWAVQGFQDVTIEGADLGGVGVPIAVLRGFSAVFLAVSALRFRVEETKTAWA